MKITDQDLQAAYEASKDTLGKPEKRHVQQIAFPDMAAATAAHDKIQSGTDFVQVAKDQGLSEADIDLGMVTRCSARRCRRGGRRLQARAEQGERPGDGQARNGRPAARHRDRRRARSRLSRRQRPTSRRRSSRSAPLARSSSCTTRSRISSPPAPSCPRSPTSSSSTIRSSIRSIGRAASRMARR